MNYISIHASDHCRWVHHSSGRVLPVGIAHPLKVDSTVGPMATAEDDYEPEEFDHVLKGSSHKDYALSKHYGSSSSKEDQSSDDNEEQNALSSTDTSDSSSSSSGEDEDGSSQEIISPPEISHKETYKKENKQSEPSHLKPRTIMKSPYPEGPATQSHSYSRSSKFITLV